jgi:hypothetical protein
MGWGRGVSGWLLDLDDLKDKMVSEEGVKNLKYVL